MKGHYYGAHRVIKPEGVTPQSAEIIDNEMKIYSNEILVDVSALHITSTAFNRLKVTNHHDIEKIKQEIMTIVSTRGKFHDPVSKSGGMLLGKVKKIGEEINQSDISIGDTIATLVSLSLTPLKIDRIKDVNLETGQVLIDGEAIIFESGIYTKIPDDLPMNVSLAIMDVAGAPIQVALNAKFGDTVVIIGAGKAGLLCLHEARKRVTSYGKVVCIEYSRARCDVVKRLNLADEIIQLDATKPFGAKEKYNSIMKGQLADFTINTVNIPDTELTSVLVTKDEGLVYFFSMSTDFTKASLGAEGAKKYTKMLIGNGYYPGHAENVFQIMRENGELRAFFEKELTE